MLGHMAFRNELFDPWVLVNHKGKFVGMKKKKTSSLLKKRQQGHLEEVENKNVKKNNILFFDKSK